MCITDDEFERSRAFLFLMEVKRCFQTSYGSRAQLALPYAMNSEYQRVLSNEMTRYSEGKSFDKISKVQGEIDELKDIMVKNIDLMQDRGERLELLVDKTENLQANAVTFQKSSRNLRRSMYWKNVKLTVIIVLVVIVVIYFIISMACGGLDWGKCVK